MIRLRLDSAGPFHTLDTGTPRSGLLLDCGLALQYRAVEVSSDVAVADRCPQCEQKRLAAVEFFVMERVETIERWWE